MRLLILCFTLLLSSQAVANRVEDWRNDISVFGKELEANHFSPFVHLTQGAFHKEIKMLKDQVPSLSDAKITIELMKLARRVGDGHTAVHYAHTAEREFPLEVYLDENQLRVIGVSDQFKHLLGATLVKIDQKPITEIHAALAPIAQFVENPYSRDRRAAQYIKYGDLLAELGLIKSPQKAMFTFDQQGKQWQIDIEALPRKQAAESIVWLERKLPNVKVVQDAGIPDLWFGVLPMQKAMYIKFTRYPNFEQMDQFGQSVLKTLRDRKLKRLVIDLRGNWGGDFYVGLWLSYYLNLYDGLDWNKGAYVLVDSGTFSAATINATQYRQLLNARVVGEPTGSNPSGVQDMGSFTLPHSGLMVSYSKRLFRLQPELNKPLQPDAIVKMQWQDWQQGTDTVMKWVLNEMGTVAKSAK